MNISIQPVIDFDALNRVPHLTAQDRADIRQRVEAVRAQLATTSDTWTVRPPSDALPTTVADDEVILWFAPSREEIERVVETLDPAVARRTILFDDEADDIFPVLEDAGVAALVTSRTVSNWLTDRDRKFFKMGQGHGFYGLKALFDGQLYEQAFVDVFSSEHYTLFYNFEVHDLGRLLEPYVRQLLLREPVSG